MTLTKLSSISRCFQDNADMEWKFARAVIIHDIAKSLPIPVPINIFHLIALLVLNVQCSKDCCQVIGYLARVTVVNIVSNFAIAHIQPEQKSC